MAEKKQKKENNNGNKTGSAKAGVKKRKVSKERKLEKELMYIIGFIVLLVIIFMTASAFFKSLNTIDYEGLTFTKGRVGNLVLYHHYYYYKSKNGNLVQYNLYLRNDPRYNNVSVEGDKVLFNKNVESYLSVDSLNLEVCPYSILGVGNLAGFLTQNEVIINGGNLDPDAANVTGQEYVTCANHSNRKVIELKEGDETGIKINGNCYEIIVNNCDVMQAIERFQIQTILDNKDRW